MTGWAGAVILWSEGLIRSGRLLWFRPFSKNDDRQGPAWRSLFSALAEGEDAYEKRGGLEDQARDLIKAHMPTPFRMRREKKVSSLLYLSKKRVDHRSMLTDPLPAV